MTPDTSLKFSCRRMRMYSNGDRMMKKIVISVLGQDRPGIIAAITKALFLADCNIENVSQTILQAEFSGIFIASIPADRSALDLRSHLEKALMPLKQHVYVKYLEYDKGDYPFDESEPFIIVTKGPDRKGLVAGITEVIAQYGANVTNMQAVFEGGDDPDKNIMIYEVDIPTQIDQQKFHEDLRNRANELGLNLSIQHRNIFKAINRI
jgi:glycine cleavage system transcriptional repressor